MLSWYRRVGLLAGGIVALALLVGCAEREHRKMIVEEEQHEGEVEPVAPGEMVPE